MNSRIKNTNIQYDEAIANCRQVFMHKMKDYGTAWRVLRNSSITDQIFIKAQRIRSIEQSGINKVGEDIASEYVGIVNYAIIGLIQLELGPGNETGLDEHLAEELYDRCWKAAKKLMQDKNHDYGEAWRDMRISSITDLILMKILRTRQIEDNEGKTLISEGIDANYLDMINYAVFALIRLKENGKA